MLERRLTRLYAAGRSEVADELARAVLRNERVEVVAVDGNTVIVETPRFRGRHALVRGTDGNSVESSGEYAFTDLALDRTFHTATIPEAALERVETVLSPNEGADADAEPVAAETANQPPEEVAADTARSLRSRLSSWVASALPVRSVR